MEDDTDGSTQDEVVVAKVTAVGTTLTEVDSATVDSTAGGASGTTNATSVDVAALSSDSVLVV